MRRVILNRVRRLEQVQFLSTNLQNQEKQNFSFQLIIELNLQALTEEDAE